MEIEIVEDRDQRTIDKLSINYTDYRKLQSRLRFKFRLFLGLFMVHESWISDKEDCPEENAEIKIEVIEDDIEPKTEPELIDLQATEESYQVC